MKTFIAIADNFISQSLTTLFTSENQVIRVENGDRKLLLNRLSTENPDVVIVDRRLVLTSHFIENINKRCKHSKIILYTERPMLSKQMAFIHSGIDGFIFPSMKTNEILATLKNVREKGFDIPGESMNFLLKLFRSQTPQFNSLNGFRVSPRQGEVLKLLCRDFNVPEVARYLSIAISTVNTHKKQLFKITGTHSISELKECGAQLGLGEYEDSALSKVYPK